MRWSHRTAATSRRRACPGPRKRHRQRRRARRGRRRLDHPDRLKFRKTVTQPESNHHNRWCIPRVANNYAWSGLGIVPYPRSSKCKALPGAVDFGRSPRHTGLPRRSAARRGGGRHGIEDLLVPLVENEPPGAQFNTPSSPTRPAPVLRQSTLARMAASLGPLDSTGCQARARQAEPRALVHLVEEARQWIGIAPPPHRLSWLRLPRHFVHLAHFVLPPAHHTGGFPRRGRPRELRAPVTAL